MQWQSILVSLNWMHSQWNFNMVHGAYDHNNFVSHPKKCEKSMRVGGIVYIHSLKNIACDPQGKVLTSLNFYWCDLNVAVCVFQGARALLLCTVYLCAEEHTFTLRLFLYRWSLRRLWVATKRWIFFSWLWFCFSRGCFYTYNVVLVQGCIIICVFLPSQYPGSLCVRWMRNRKLNCCGLTC